MLLSIGNMSYSQKYLFKAEIKHEREENGEELQQICLDLTDKNLHPVMVKQENLSPPLDSENDDEPSESEFNPINEVVQTTTVDVPTKNNKNIFCANILKGPGYIEKQKNTANNPQLTKSGQPRKRKKFDTPLAERKKEKFEKKLAGHGVKSGCDEECKKRCIEKISESTRIILNKKFWELNRQEQKQYLCHHVSSKPIQQVTVDPAERRRLRSQSHSYFLKDRNGTLQNVCKSFFLSTLGYSKNSSQVLRALAEAEKPTEEVEESYVDFSANVTEKELIIKKENEITIDVFDEKEAQAQPSFIQGLTESEVSIDIVESQNLNSNELSGEMAFIKKEMDTLKDLYFKETEPQAKMTEFQGSAADRPQEKYNSKGVGHGVKSGCGTICKKRCHEKITESTRIFLNRKYWELSPQEQNQYLCHHVSSKPIQRATVDPSKRQRIRSQSHSYFLKDQRGTLQNVCKKFFLTTLGYDKNNHKVLRVLGKANQSGSLPEEELSS